jgi:hypothetical protein
MPPVVPVDTALLFQGLRDVFQDAVKAIDDALAPDDQETARLDVARQQYARVEAFGKLLGAIDWAAGDPTQPFALDVETHGWAAITALERLIERQRFAAWQFAEAEDAEASGEASGLRLEAEQDLARIRSACRDGEVTIVAPKP